MNTLHQYRSCLEDINSSLERLGASRINLTPQTSLRLFTPSPLQNINNYTIRYPDRSMVTICPSDLADLIASGGVPNSSVGFSDGSGVIIQSDGKCDFGQWDV
jgi:hypothetical protein